LSRNGLHNWLHSLLNLLLIVAHIWNSWSEDLLLCSHRQTKVQSLELLRSSRHAGELLLQALLLRRKKKVGRDQFRIELLIHWLATFIHSKINSRRGKNMFRQGIHLARHIGSESMVIDTGME